MGILNLIKDKLLKKSGQVMIALVISSGFMYLFRVLMARNLTITEYGLFYSISAILTLIVTFVDFGLGDTYIKFFCQYKAEKDYGRLKGLIYMIFLTRAMSGLILMLIILFSANFMMANFFKSGDGKLLFLILSLGSIITSVFFNLVHATFRALHLTRDWGYIRVINSSSLVILAFLSFLFWKSSLPIAIILVLIPVVMAVCYYNKLKKHLPEIKGIKPIISFSEWKKLMAFGLSIISMSICNYILNSTDTVMLTYFSSLDSVGLYNVALPLARLFLIFSAAINTPLLPYLSELYAKKDMAGMKKTFYQINKLSLLLLFPCVIIIALVSKYLLWIFFGKIYIPAYVALSLLAFSSFFSLIFNVNLIFFISMGKTRLGNVLIIIGAVLNIILNYFFILKWDYVGASLATLISYFVIAALSFLFARQYFSCDILPQPKT